MSAENKPRYKTILVRTKDYEIFSRVGKLLHHIKVVDDENPTDALVFNFATKSLSRDVEEFHKMMMCNEETSKSLN